MLPSAGRALGQAECQGADAAALPGEQNLLLAQVGTGQGTLGITESQNV